MANTLEESRPTVPAFVIRLAFEAPRPEVRIDCLTEGEFLRLAHWLEENPTLGSLLEDALDLGGYE